MTALANVFAGDIFSTISLTEAMMLLPSKPNKLADMGLFPDDPVKTLTVSVEEHDGVLSLIQTSQRGTRGREMRHGKRKSRAFDIPHIGVSDNVRADEVQGIRKFGGEANDLETVSDKVAERLQVMKDSLDITQERMR